MLMVEEQEQTGAVISTSSLLDDIMAQARIRPVDEAYSVAKQGIAAVVSQLLDNGNTTGVINRALVDSMIVALDRKLSDQMDVSAIPSYERGVARLLRYDRHP